MNSLDTRDQIKARMLRDTARLWGLSDNQLDTTAFDPLVDLLLGTLAAESERVYGEILASRGRILERLVQVLLPETVTGPRPAHGLLMAQPTENRAVAAHDMPLTVRHPQTGDELGLLPAGRFSLLNGRVVCGAAGAQLWRLDDQQNRTPVASAPPHRRLPEYTLWLGLDLPLQSQYADSESDNTARFYFNWKNQPNAMQYCAQLGQTGWQVEGSPARPLTAIHTLQPEPADNGATDTADLHELEQHAQRYYRPHFVTVTLTDVGPAGAAPAILTDSFDAALLQTLPPLTWLRVSFPPTFSADMLQQTDCLLNAFPVLNIQASTPTFRLNDILNVFPLQTDRPLLAVVEVTDSEGNTYAPHTLGDDPTRRTYTLRHRGVGRFDSRQAADLVQHTLDQLRDDSAAFLPLGYDALRGQVEDIQKSMQRIRQQLPPAASLPGEPTPFLIINNAPTSGTLFVRCWTTAADRANRLPLSAKVDTTSPALRRDRPVSLLQPLLGGMARLNDAASLPAFRRTLLTRGRALTAEDLRAIALATAPDLITGATIQKSVAVGTEARQGLTRVLDVRLAFRAGRVLAADEKEHWCREVAAQIDGLWAGVLPIRVIPETA
ncbi:type VI secretion system baseplate subunit TssF [Fibrella sp. HMF5335]|uniref:Type VI secretion system baseplate subunit TssF n=1 Tax=Fibrella rubiginis TaxID=2817060 RepID=A0A939GH65_9BACT|nr:type VI secretion system baseplate subunit TssF [Fibrella rubiginis]MBO0936696.1 type VI secretion system baseplate subunit TssF [Fibrella rubiginis]